MWKYLINNLKCKIRVEFKIDFRKNFRVYIRMYSTRGAIWKCKWLFWIFLIRFFFVRIFLIFVIKFLNILLNGFSNFQISQKKLIKKRWKYFNLIKEKLELSCLHFTDLLKSEHWINLQIYIQIKIVFLKKRMLWIYKKIMNWINSYLCNC